MTWQIALALNALFATIRSGIQKVAVTRVDPQLFLLWVNGYFLIEAFLLYVFINHRVPTLYPVIFLLGMVFAISTTCLFAAIRISLSQTSLLGTYAMVIPMILSAVFLGESSLFNPRTANGIRTIAGMATAVVSLWLMTRSTSTNKQATDRMWLLFIATYIIFDGAGQFWNKLVLANHETMEILVSQMIGNTFLLFVILKIRKIPLRIEKHANSWAAIDSIAEVGFAVFLLLAYKLGPLSIILPIQKLATIIGGMLLGLLIFHEQHAYTKAKIAGAAIGIVGIILLII